MNKKSIKYIVGIAVLVVAIVLALVFCGKDNEDDKENTGVEGGLQVEESGEGDSIDFEDFMSDDEDDTTDTDKDGTPDKTDNDDDNDGVKDDKDEDDNNDGTLDKEDPKHPEYEGSDKEENKEDNKEDNKENDDENVKDDEETGWSPFF